MLLGRSFYINKDNSSCEGDVGWFMVLFGNNCFFEFCYFEIVFMYSKFIISVNWNDYGKCNIFLFVFMIY